MKKVVVASGKGGTGKTTLTALFALEAAHTGTVVVADADVEAPNLPIALHARDEVCEEFKGGHKAEIDPALCTGCGQCGLVCRFDAVHDGASVGDPRIHEIDEWSCEGCGACARVCPVGAVTMVESTAGAACIATSSVGPLAFGRLGPGEDMSGRLVTEVRDRANAAAAEIGADLMLIDGPPGIGCPVIAAVTNTDVIVAVTEPSASGAHDLGRLIELAERFSIPVRVVLNKGDLSAQGAAGVRGLCERSGVELIAEIPYDATLAATLATLAEGGEVDGDSPGLAAAREAWAAVAATL